MHNVQRLPPPLLLLLVVCWHAGLQGFMADLLGPSTARTWAIAAGSVGRQASLPLSSGLEQSCACCLPLSFTLPPL
jgi:hypothetical protein